MNILQTTDLKKYYGTEPNITKALDGVTLSIEEGEFVAIVVSRVLCSSFGSVALTQGFLAISSHLTA